MAHKRAMADLAEIQKDIYKTSGIYYEQQNDSCLDGIACVFGPKDTPYEDCPMFYTFQMPSTYPFDPPKVQFKTYHRGVRFHPNMYVEGKVCLSILHTWTGPKWASTMRISTVLVTLQSLMDTDPLLHEPGYASRAHTENCQAYAEYVKHACISFILECIENPGAWPKDFQPFREQFEERIPETLKRLEKRIDALETINTTYLPYGYSHSFTKSDLQERLVKLNMSRMTINK